MNKKQRYIICIVVGVLLILLLVLIGFIVGRTKNNSEVLIDIIGVYHSDNWNNNEATLILNDDNTCKYPKSNDICTWTILDKKITIILTYYMITNDGNEQLPVINSYGTKEGCEKDIEKYENVYNLVNPTCKRFEYMHSAILGNNGIILHEHLFNKVG